LKFTFFTIGPLGFSLEHRLVLDCWIRRTTAGAAGANATFEERGVQIFAVGTLPGMAVFASSRVRS